MDAALDETTRAFLTTCFQENLGHMRHIENERITFFSLYLVMVGMLMGAATNASTSPVVAIMMTLLLFVMGMIATVLPRRWNQVFSAHRDAACDLCKALGKELPFTTNMLFIFDNKQYLVDKAARAGAPQDAQAPLHPYGYTAELFRLFNLTIIALECCVLALNILRLLGVAHGL